MPRRVTVTLPDDIYDELRQIGSEVESSLAGQLRRGARMLLGEPPAPDVSGEAWRVTGTKGDGSELVRLGAVEILTARAVGIAQGAHIVSDGVRRLLVAPDGASSGLRRSLCISEALVDVEGGTVDPIAYVAGCLWVNGLGVLGWDDGSSDE
jgi:hypothetical protein